MLERKTYSLSFWTALQQPFCQAVRVENNSVDFYKPKHGPKTPARQIGYVCEYEENLFVVTPCGYAVWDRVGNTLYESYHKLMYGVHMCEQFKYEGKTYILVCSSGHDLFMLMDPKTGETIWEFWFNPENDIIDKYSDQEYKAKHISKTLGKSKATNKQHHFNSVTILDNGLSFLTSDLFSGEIYIIDVLDSEGKLITNPDMKNVEKIHSLGKSVGAHCPITIESNGCFLMFGGEKGIYTLDLCEKPVINKLFNASWVKTIRCFPQLGYVFTHTDGVSMLDLDLNLVANVVIPASYGIADLRVIIEKETKHGT